jgi:monoterpene epsilon-lactone hydrolase
MASEEIKRVREFLASLPDRSQMSIEEARAQTDKFAGTFPLPEGMSVEKVDAGGVPGEWVKAPGARDNYAILYLHGGGYVFGSPTSHRHLVAAISEAAGGAALSLEYRLAPEHPFPAAVDDAVTAYRWLLKKGSKPGRIAVAGDSSGGGLTVASLSVLRDAGDPLPAAGICISPWADLTCSAQSYQNRAGTDPIVSQEVVLQLAPKYLGGKDPKTPLASPIFADLANLPPLLIQVGSEEVLLDDSIRLDRRAREVGVDSTLEIWDDMVHVWHRFAPMLKEGREAIARIGKFIKARMG